MEIGIISEPFRCGNSNPTLVDTYYTTTTQDRMHVMPVYIFFHSSMLLWKKRRGIAIVLQQEASLPDVSTALCFNSLPLVSFIKCLYMHDYILLLSEFYYNNDRTCCATHWDLQNVSSCCSTGPPNSPSLLLLLLPFKVLPSF